MFKKTVDKIKEVNKNCVTPQSYDCSDTTNKTNNYLLLSLMTGETTVYSGIKESVPNQMFEKGKIIM